MTHIILRVKQDTWDGSLGNCPVRSTLPLFFANEPLLVLGKLANSRQQQLIVLKLDNRRPYPMFININDIEATSNIHFAAATSIDTGDIYSVDSHSLEHISLLFRDSDEWTQDERTALYDYCRNSINECLKVTSPEQVSFVPSVAETMDRFPDAIMSQQLHDYESYPLLNPDADNYIVDCRSVPTREALADYLKPSLSLSKGNLFEDALRSAVYLVKHEGKVLASPQLHIYFTNTEYLFCGESNPAQAIHKLLDSLHKCADLWPGDLDFFGGENERTRFKSVFYYIKKSESTDVVNQILIGQGERTLQQSYFYG